MFNVVLIGSGGVGTIASYVLEYSGKAKVTSVIRSDYDVVTKNGYEIESVNYGHIPSWKPSRIVKDVESAAEYGPYDFVVVATKNIPDISKVEDLIEPVVSETSTIMLLQNGFRIEESVIEKFPKCPVLSGVSMIGSANKNGKISQEVPDGIKIGYFINDNLPKDVQEKATRDFIDCYANDKNDCIYDPDVKFTRWRKLVYNATLNSACAITNLDIGRLEIFGGTDAIVRAAMKEVLAIAKSDGVDIPEETMEFMIRDDDPVYYSPSMVVDVRKGNYIEMEVIVGNAVRVGKKNNVDCPVLSIMYEFLKVIQNKTKESKGVIVIPKDRPVPKR